MAVNPVEKIISLFQEIIEAVKSRLYEKEEATIFVTKTWTRFGKVVKQKEKEVKIPIRSFTGPVAHMSVRAQRTVNLGNFNGAQYAMMFTCPCYVEEAKEIADKLDEFVLSRVKQHADEIIAWREKGDDGFPEG